MTDFLTYLPYLLFMNHHIGLPPMLSTEHCIAIHTGSSLRACNRVCNTTLPTDEEIEEIKAYFGNAPFTWAIADGDKALQAMLKQHRLSYVASFSEIDSTPNRPI